MLRCTLLIIAAIVLIGHMNAQDIKQCTAQGYSADWCLAVFNP